MSYIIYKICCDDLPEFIYVGSTKSFRDRKYRHKKDCNTSNIKLYTTIRENGGWDKWRMVILEDIGEVSLTQARIKEEEHRVKLNANMNERKCYITEEQKKEYNKEYKKEYEKKNAIKIKEWKEQNKENKKQYDIEYYNNNKEQIHKQHSEWNKVKIICDCGKKIARGGISHHKNSLFHKKYISNII